MQHSRALTQKSASNLALAFVLLPREKRDAMSALYGYCDRVASAVGRLSVRVFGLPEKEGVALAYHLGRALQLTNILRDVKADAVRGRIYLPQSELQKFNVSEAEILDSKYSERYFALATSVAGRARNFYQLAQNTLPAEDRRTMVAAELMGSVYWRLLQKLEANRFDVFGPQTVKLGKPHKLALIFRSWLRFAAGSSVSDYGIP